MTKNALSLFLTLILLANFSVSKISHGEEADYDEDGIADDSDNCVYEANPDQHDTDSDSIGDVCDATPYGEDTDSDGIVDQSDNCVNDINEDQADTDGDGTGDACDPTPEGDDSDGDGIFDISDNCVSVANEDQSDSDSDGLGDACDATPYGADTDGDGVYDMYDNCVSVVNPEQEDEDGDGEGDACELCLNPLPLDGTKIDRSKILVSGADNVYTYNAYGAVSLSIGGQAPYLCAWDFNGDGSQDSSFGNCDKAIQNAYNNYVGNRKIHLIVKDSCNVSTSTEVVKPIPRIVRTPGDGTVFIHGKVIAGSGESYTHPAIFENGVGTDYWATNHIPNDVHVQASILFKGDRSEFSISSDKFTYGGPLSETFGMKIEIADVAIKLGELMSTTTVSVANAKLSSIKYSTDKIGDSKPAITLSGGYANCQLFHLGMTLIDTAGTPCKIGTTNPDFSDKEMRWIFHSWGAYSCSNLSGVNATAAVVGEFDGYSILNDQCEVGGPRGGEPPPKF